MAATEEGGRKRPPEGHNRPMARPVCLIVLYLQPVLNPKSYDGPYALWQGDEQGPGRETTCGEGEERGM